MGIHPVTPVPCSGIFFRDNGRTITPKKTRPFDLGWVVPPQDAIVAFGIPDPKDVSAIILGGDELAGILGGPGTTKKYSVCDSEGVVL